jgi:hypothetical protein
MRFKMQDMFPVPLAPLWREDGTSCTSVAEPAESVEPRASQPSHSLKLETEKGQSRLMSFSHHSSFGMSYHAGSSDASGRPNRISEATTSISSIVDASAIATTSRVHVASLLSRVTEDKVTRALAEQAVTLALGENALVTSGDLGFRVWGFRV